MKTEHPQVVRFGAFEADLGTGELRRGGSRVKLQEQPFQVLRALLEQPGELVTRRELRARIWPAAVFVDFEVGLNRAVNRLRRALSDAAERPRFVETLPGRGYRFIAPVEGRLAPAPASPAVCHVNWRSEDLPLRDGENVVGRGEDAAVPVDAHGVSRRHARIVVSGRTATLEDLGSKNGTFLNGRRLEGPAPLGSGDEIQLGSALMVFWTRSPRRPTSSLRR